MTITAAGRTLPADTLFDVSEEPSTGRASTAMGAGVDAVELADLRPDATIIVRSQDQTLLQLRLLKADGDLRPAQLLIEKADSVEIADDSGEPPVCGEWQEALLASADIRAGASLSIRVTPRNGTPYTLSLGRVAELRLLE